MSDLKVVTFSPTIDAIAYDKIPIGPEHVTSRLLIRTPPRRWWHRPLAWIGWYRLTNWWQDRNLVWNEPCGCHDYVIVSDPAAPEPGHWEHDA